jgi:hypothetical protein
MDEGSARSAGWACFRTRWRSWSCFWRAWSREARPARRQRQPSPDYPLFGNNYVAGDFNGDGSVDLAGNGQFGASVGLNNGTGMFGAVVDYAIGGQGQDIAAGVLRRRTTRPRRHDQQPADEVPDEELHPDDALKYLEAIAGEIDGIRPRDRSRFALLMHDEANSQPELKQFILSLIPDEASWLAGE